MLGEQGRPGQGRASQANRRERLRTSNFGRPSRETEEAWRRSFMRPSRIASGFDRPWRLRRDYSEFCSPNILQPASSYAKVSARGERSAFRSLSRENSSGCCGLVSASARPTSCSQFHSSCLGAPEIVAAVRDALKGRVSRSPQLSGRCAGPAATSRTGRRLSAQRSGYCRTVGRRVPGCAASSANDPGPLCRCHV